MFGRAQPRPVDRSYCINGSVFSEAFLVGVDALVTIVMDFSGIARSVFLDLIAPDCHVVTALKRALFEIFAHTLLFVA